MHSDFLFQVNMKAAAFWTSWSFLSKAEDDATIGSNMLQQASLEVMKTYSFF